MNKIKIYDTTLRDGMQAEGISFSLEDKLLIAKRLDEFGVDYIEGGFPMSNPKEMQFFEQVAGLDLKNAHIVAFGSTRRPNVKVADDTCMKILLGCGAPVVTLVGKSWDLHVKAVLNCTYEENLAICADSVSYMKSNDKEVIFDAEHFFDGYKANCECAMNVLSAVVKAGADTIVLCETNGGCLPQEVYNITKVVCETFGDITVGIHTHNDSDCAVANTLEAVWAGARHVQGTINGIGERTGNANLCTVIPNLAFKMSFDAVCANKAKLTSALNKHFGVTTGDKKELTLAIRKTQELLDPEKGGLSSAFKQKLSVIGRDAEKLAAELQRNYDALSTDKGKLAGILAGSFEVLSTVQIKKLTELSRFIFEIANLTPVNSMPYVGESAFAHKGGLHIDALRKNEHTYEHISPDMTGNQRRFLISELSGSSNVLAKLENKNLVQDRELARKILHRVQDLENEGYQFEAAEASFEIMVKKTLGLYKPSFKLDKYHVNVERNSSGQIVTEATVKITVDGVTEHVVSEGDGPVNALDCALRKSLEGFYPGIKDMHLIDYKVRVVNARAATAAKVRVIIESRDHDSIWGTVGVSENLIEASWEALVDSIEYKLMKDKDDSEPAGDKQ